MATKPEKFYESHQYKEYMSRIKAVSERPCLRQIVAKNHVIEQWLVGKTVVTLIGFLNLAEWRWDLLSSLTTGPMWTDTDAELQELRTA